MKRRTTYQRQTASVERFSYLLIGSIAGCTFFAVGMAVLGL